MKVSAFNGYLERLNRTDWLKLSDPGSWVVAAVISLGIIAVGAWIPSTAPYLQLAPAGPLIATAGWVALMVPTYLVLRAEGNSRRFRVLCLIGSGWLEFLALQLVISAGTWPARAVFGLFLLLSMLTHGGLLRVTPDAPYLGAWSSLLCGISVLQSGSPDLSLFVLLVFVAGLFAMFQGGRLQHEKDLQEVRQQQEQEALSATLLAQSHSVAARLELQLTQLMGAHHDARNLLTTALLKSSLLQRKLKQGGSPLPESEISTTLTSVGEALTLVTSIFSESTRLVSAGETFDWRQVLEMHLADFQSRKSGLRLHITAQPAVSMNVPGGHVTVRRILENILLNASEGDGKRGADNVWVETDLGAGRLHLRIADDGPGFPPEVLASARQRMTLKKTGSGLGLLTVDSLVRACGGVLQLSNRPSGGAQVDVFLPILETPSLPEGAAA